MLKNLGICVNMLAEFKCYSRRSRVLCPATTGIGLKVALGLRKIENCQSLKSRIYFLDFFSIIVLNLKYTFVLSWMLFILELEF